MKQQTAVEWLVEQLEERGHIIPDHIEVTSLEMEKQQIIKAGLDRGSFIETEEMEQYYNETYGSKGSDEHIVDTNKMVKRGTLKKRMDKDAWFVVFQSNAYNESDMVYELIKSQEIDIDMYDVYKDGDEVTFELVNKKWAKITPFLYPFKTTSSQTEISDEEIYKVSFKKESIDWHHGFIEGAKWYREQLKQRQ